MQIRRLTATDAAEYREIRLKSLKEHPEAFGMAFEEEEKIPLEDIVKRFEQHAMSEENIVLGAFVEGRLIGILGFARYPLQKFRHVAHMNQTYVAPETRGLGAGKALMTAALEHGRKLPGLEKVILSVVPDNIAARKLYLWAGFETYGLEKKGLKVGERYYDLEMMDFWY